MSGLFAGRLNVNHGWFRGPGCKRAGEAAFQALGGVELGAALGALAVLEKNVERLPALTTTPEVALQRRGMTGRAGKTFASGHFGASGQRPRLFKTSPAIP